MIASPAGPAAAAPSADPRYNCSTMPGLATVLIAAVLANPAPLALETQRDLDALTLSFRLLEPLPEEIETALPSGAVARIRYPIRVRSPRRLWFDRKIWKGNVVASAKFDLVTGRYRCELVLDGVIVTSRDIEELAGVRAWLADPGPIRLALPEARRASSLRVRVRAIYSSSTKWLVFPSVDGTGWVDIPVPSVNEDPEAASPVNSES
jgi:hypothetical protein